MPRRTAASGQVVAVAGLSVLLAIVAIILILEFRHYGPELQQVVVPQEIDVDQ